MRPLPILLAILSLAFTLSVSSCADMNGFTVEGSIVTDGARVSVDKDKRITVEVEK